MNPSLRRLRFQVLTVLAGLTAGVLLILSSTRAVWAGKDSQTIPTVTPTVNGQPPVTLPDGLVTDTPADTSASFPRLQYAVWPVGCCLLLCMAALIPLGIFLFMRTRRQPTSTSAK
jgi:hypothetical protein